MTKLATFVLSPLGGHIALLLLAGWWAWSRRRGRAVGVLAVAMLWLYAWSCPAVVDALTRWWEGNYPPVPVAELPAVPLAVVLGGGISAHVPPRLHPELNDAADRVWHAARLYHAGKAETILVSAGGVRPGSPPGMRPAAEDTAPFLVDLGVPSEAILLETNSMNTIDNALLSAEQLEILGAGRFLLVTSAIHMPRSMHAFRHAGLNPIPVATDYRAIIPGTGPLRFLPTPDTLEQSSATLKELVGLLYYRVRYPIPAPLPSEQSVPPPE